MAIIGKIVAMTGTAVALSDNGAKRDLHLGDQIQSGDTIQTAKGVFVDLELTNGRVIHIAAEQLVAFTPELVEAIVPNSLDSAINLATIDTVIKAIEGGKDINDVLEETAAGSNGLLTIHGFDFVNLLRINEVLNNFRFAYEYSADGRLRTDPLPDENNNLLIVQSTVSNAVNDAPVAVITPASGNEDTSIVVNLSGTDIDGTITAVTVTSLPLVSEGVLYLADGITAVVAGVSLTPTQAAGLIFQPALNYNGPVDIAFTVTDNQGATSPIAHTPITVVSVNDAPVAVITPASGNEDTSIVVNLSGTDIDGTITAVTVTSLPLVSEGVLYLADGITAVVAGVSLTPTQAAGLIFQPALNYNGPVDIAFTVTDNQGATSPIAHTPITVVSVNDAPVANSDIASTPINTSINNIDVKANDTDPDNTNAQLTVTAPTLANPAQGTVTINQDGTLNFTPATGVTGPVSITYTLTDPAGLTSDGTLIVNVGNNNPPDSADVTKTIDEDTSLILGAGDFAFTDPDALQTINAVRIDTLPINGVLTLNGNLVIAGQVIPVALITAGDLQFTPALNGNGNNYANISFSVQDSAGAFDTVPNTLTINVTPVNDAPVAVITPASGNEDTSIVVNLSGTDIDGTITAVTVTSLPLVSEGVLYLADGITAVVAGVSLTPTQAAGLIFQPALNYNGPVDIAFTVTDNQGATSPIAHTPITVVSVNDAPVAVITPASGNEDTSIVVNLSGTDIDGTITAVTVTSLPLVSEGVLYLADGITAVVAGVSLTPTQAAGLIFQPALNYNGPVDIAFTVTDNQGATSPIAHTPITVVSVNDAPVANSDIASTPINTSINNIDVKANDTDPDNTNAQLTVTAPTLANPAQGTVTINQDGTLNFTPATGVTGPVSITYTLTDPAGLTSDGTLIVNVGNNNPPDSADVTKTIDEDTSLILGAGDFAFTDPDALQTINAVRIDTLPINGVLTLNGNLVIAGQVIPVALITAGDLQFTPALNGNGNNYANISFSVQDSAGAFDTVPNTLTINVTPVNDAAVITPAIVNLTESDAVLTTGGTLAISDVDSPATFVAQTNAAGSNGYGTFTLGTNGAWTYSTTTPHNEFVAGTTYTDTLTVTSADGTTSTIKVNILGTNDAAVITPAIVNLTESDAVLTTGGTLAISDVDSPATFVAQTNAAGSNGYGTFTLGTNGAWTYSTTTPHNEFVAGTTYTDTLTVTSADGTTSTIKVNILGTNDAAVITPAIVNLTESDAVLTTGGTLAISDVDSPATFVAQTNAAGSNGYGTFTLGTNGAWTYSTTTPHNEFVAGTTYTDTLTVTSADGTTSTIKVNILGTNDAAVITPAIVNLTESDAVLTTGGTLAISDVDSPATFVAQTNAAGSNGYGTFTLGTNGAWTYSTTTPHNEFVAGTTYTDTLTVTSADGTTSTIKVNILGTNDAAVITPAIVNLTESDAVLTTGGTLAISDVDSPATFVAQTNAAGSNGYGTFTLGTNGAWTYSTTTPHNEFVAGTTYTDTLTVTSADGTTSTIKVNILGTNDAAVITPAIVNLTESDAVLTTGGTLAISDVDSPATFVAQTNAAGSNGYGTFTLGTNGAWTYSTTTPHNEFVAGTTYTDTLTVTSADGTTSTIKVNILGTNDAAVITPAIVNLTESDAVLTTGGTLAISDVDSPATFVAQTNAAGSNGYGTFTLGTNGAWTYSTTTPHNEFVAGTTYTDTLTVTSADGTTSTIKVNILGTNDAAVITPAIVNLTESDAVLTTGGTLAISDVDSPATFVAQTNAAGSNGYGTFTLGTNGAWTYSTTTPHNEFVAGTTYTDTLTVTSADGTTSTIKVNILGTNDAAVITPAIVNLTESDAVLTTGGTLAISDVDSPATFVAQTNAAGSNGYGTFTLGTNGAWTYSTTTPHNEFVAGTTYTDTLTVTSADGTTSTIKVNILGTNDAAVITPAIVNLTESDAVLTTGGTLAISDVDSPATFVAQTNAAGSNGYGTFTLGTNGAWTYSTTTPHNEFVAGTTYTDTLTVTSADGTTSTIKVNILGTNDAAVITPAIVNLTESDAVLTTGGTLAISDVDSPATFVAQTNAAGSNGYGTFTLGTNGAWTYSTTTPHNEFVAGTTYTDTLTVTSADGTTSTIKVNILGTNDAAVITPAIVNLTESDAVLTTGGTLAISDVDSPATFVAQTNAAGSNGYGTFTLGTNGAWTYSTTTPHNEFVAGTTYTDTLTVTSADGTTSTIKVNILGTNDAAVITPAIVNLTESDAVLTTGGTLAISDVDSPATFVAQTNAAGSNGYGTFTLGTNGAWTYSTTTPHNEFVAGTTYTDTLTVTSADGTTSTIKVNILGTNDAAVITPAIVNLTESDAVLTTGGTLAISDVDSPATFVAQTNAAGSNGYGTFTLGTNGAWTYSTTTPHNEFVAGTTYTDTLTVTSADGTTSTIKVNILGTNDAPVVGTSTALVAEEALLNGNLDSDGDSAISTGTIVVTDADSSSISVTLTAPVESLTSGGLAVVWSGSGTQTMIGKAGGVNVISATIDNSGNYTVTLFKPIDHVTSGAEDTKSITFGVSATDGLLLSSTGSLNVLIEDDSPVANTSTTSVGATASNTNLSIVLDLSGSMFNAGSSGLAGLDRITVTIAAIKELIDGYDSLGNVMVNISTFGTTANNGTWMTAANAIAFLNGLPNLGNTNYDAALRSAMDSFAAPGKLTAIGSQNVLYFLSDGAPTIGDNNPADLLNVNGGATDTGINPAEEGLWTNFLTTNKINAFAFGLGSGVTTSAMDPVAYNGVISANQGSTVVSDLSTLSSTLASTVTSSATGQISIGGTGTGGFGADGGHLAQLTYGTNSFIYNNVANTVIRTGAGSTLFTYNSTTHMLELTTAGGTYDINMDTGTYTFATTAAITVPSEVFGYTLIDNDGDTASGSLTINLNTFNSAPIARDESVIVQSTDISGGTVTIKDAWLLWNDSDREGNVLSISSVANATSHIAGQIVDTLSANNGSTGGFTYLVTDGNSLNDAVVSTTTTTSTTLTGNGLDNILIGGTGNDTLIGNEGSDVLVGNAGNDSLNGGIGRDLLIGGKGNDSLIGGLGVDTFKWELADQATNSTVATQGRDTIADFNIGAISPAAAANGDVLDLRDLLVGETTGTLDHYLHIVYNSTNNSTIIQVNTAGAFTSGHNAETVTGATNFSSAFGDVTSNVNQQIVLAGVNFTSLGTSDTQIINNLIAQQKLITD